MRKVFLGIISILSFVPLFAKAQYVSGVVNSYYKVSTIQPGYIQIAAGTDLSNLHAGDKVLLIQMTGVNLDTINPAGFPSNQLNYSNPMNAGKYELLAVSSVNDALDRVFVTVTLDPSKFTSGEKIQLVKIFEADYAIVNGTLTADGWNGHTGGILAMVIFKKLTLNANIDVSSKGFLGGIPVTNYTAGCNSESILYYKEGINNKAGNKGEGCAKADWKYTIGTGRIVTGGGGGHGYFGGGGGGGHYGNGGTGGTQKNNCDPGAPKAGYGEKLNNFYGYDRVTMGGGGGSSTQDATYTATRGGNGGGIVILLTDTIVGNGYSILSNGESVIATATAGAGGGGAGGSILLDMNVISGNLGLQVKGGKGGNAEASLLTGAGGGGGGGIVWYSGLSALPAGITVDFSGGARGTGNSVSYNGVAGSPGGYLNNLRFPLNGFLFNSLVKADTICAGMKPGVIRGSMPKGRLSAFVYEWYQRTEGNNWELARGSGDSLHFYADELFETTYFTRVVKSGVISDTALPVKIYVHNSINGNSLNIRDTLCHLTSPGTLTVGPLTGGNGIYTYTWQSKTGLQSWQDRAYTSFMIENPLGASTYYRRIVKSARVCIDTSNTDTLTVIPRISGNSFLRNDTAVCSGLHAGTVKASLPSGGDGTYRYSWLTSNNNTLFSPVGSASGQNYSPGILTQDKYYKRIVYSGSDNVCKDTTDLAFRITVYESISNNSISTDETLYCFEALPNPITGTIPSGGNGPEYSYQWVQKTEGNWIPINNANAISYDPFSGIEDTTFIRRVVFSGDYDACKDSSNMIRLDVIPFINNSLLSRDSAICYGAVPLPFSEGFASGGTGIEGYLWESAPAGSDMWQAAPGVNNQISYTPGDLYESARYRRVVFSNICTDYSNAITITVYPLISNNLIGNPVQYNCYNAEKQITGALPAGGNTGNYRYLWEKSTEAVLWEPADNLNGSRSYTTSALTDTSFFRRIVFSGQYDQCIDTSLAVLIRINPLPSGDIISAIDTACEGGYISVQYTALQGPSPWSLVIGDDEEVYTASGLFDPEGEIRFRVYKTAGLRVLDLIDDSTCHADLSTNTGIFSVTVFDYPEANAGMDTEICGPEISLAAIPSFGNGVWTMPGAVFNDENDPHTSVLAPDYGTYTFAWTETNWHCSNTDETEITFYEQPLVPDLGQNVQLDFIFEYQLNAPLPLGEGYWECLNREVLFDDPSLPDATVTFPYPVTGDYILKWTVINGVCPSVSNTLVVTVGEVKIYNGFSPNGDGVNDQFIIKLSGQGEATLLIFDRWGNMVFRDSQSHEIVWEGGNAPEGTYFYILNLPSPAAPEKGYIELRR